MEIALYLIILGEVTLLCSIIAYRFFLNDDDDDDDDDDDSCVDWFQKKGRKNKGRIKRREKEDDLDDLDGKERNDSALILFDKNYQRFIQQNGSVSNSRLPCLPMNETPYNRNNEPINTYDEMDDITSHCIEQSLRYKARKERGTARRVTFQEAVITPKCPVVVGLFSTVKPAAPNRRVTETPESVMHKDGVQRRLRYDEDEEDEEEECYLPPIKKKKCGMYRTPEERSITVCRSPGSLWSLKNDRDKFLRVEVAIGEALTRGEGEMFHMLRSCLVELLGMSPVTEEDRTRRDALVKFIKRKLKNK